MSNDPIKDESGNLLPRNFVKQFRDVQGGIEYLKESADNVSVELKGIKKSIDSLKKNTSDLKKDTSSLKKDTSSLKKATKENTRAISENSTDLKAVIKKLNKMDADFRKHQAEMAKQKKESDDKFNTLLGIVNSTIKVTQLMVDTFEKVGKSIKNHK